MRKLLMTFTMCGLCYVAAAQQEVNAVKTLHAPVIDGNLDDVAWKTAPVLSGFIQNLPNFGAPSSAPTEVKVLYDNDAIYIAAFLYDEPSLVRNQLTARDAEKGQNADYFSVFFDTYNDQQNGFQFLVTPANVQSDTKLNPGAAYTSGEFGDRTWDAVWQSRTQLTSKGWQVEMRIPYLSLRFAKKDIQTWGIQFLRFIRRNNESAYWNATNPNINGFINQFGRLVNLEHIRPPLRLSFSPYVSGGVRFNPSGSDREKEVLRNGGMDVKYGLNESFTLDVTLIPDFGQVVSDNVINNLSPFEIRFQENRPFFSEGTELFNKAGLFYSRRVGATPMYYDSVRRFADNNPGYLLHRNPSVVQLYNGLKFSGRTRNKLGIGIFNAVTAPAKAKLQEIVGRNDTTIETEPLTNYNIIVLDQALKGRSSVTFTNTSVMRNASARDANVSALDWSLYTSESQYRVNGTFRYSKIFGYTPYNGSVNFIDDTITRYGKLYVKPYDGFSTILRFGKVSGRIQFSGSAAVESDTYDPNDLGFIPVSNEVVYNASVSYNDFTPGRSFLNYRHSLNSRYTRLYRPDAFSQVEFWYTGSWYLRNFWEFTFNAGVQPVAQHDYFELRTPKRYLERPGFFYLSAIGNTDIRKKLF
ncbi:MAG TPA: DUF5916 domain-containing protein, partial [Flavisolibacter sp.]